GGRPETAVLPVADHLDVRKVRRYHLGGSVTRRVVDDDELEAGPLLIQALQAASQQVPDVVGDDDDGDRRRPMRLRDRCHFRSASDGTQCERCQNALAQSMVWIASLIPCSARYSSTAWRQPSASIP